MASLFNELMQHLFNPNTYDRLEEDAKRAINNSVNYPVYDVSNVVPLFSSIEGEDITKNGLPKRPPHKWMWVEWRVDENPGRFTYLMLLIKVDKKDLVEGGDFGHDLHEKAVECNEFYTSVVFKRYDGGVLDFVVGEEMESGVTKFNVMPHIGTISQEDCQAVYMFQEDCRIIKYCHYLGVPDEDKFKLSYYGLPWSKVTFEDDYYFRMLLYMPFAAFSMLHCKNIKEVEIEPDQALQKARKRRGKLPLYGYHILKLNVSVEEKHRIYGVENSEDKIHMRHHMVRGHFKNLQHDKFKCKGLYWWPEHWRGNPELGIVEKDYKIEMNPRVK
jgi:hypothetical protein